MTKYINLELSENDKEDNRLTKRQYLRATTATTTATSTARATNGATATTTITKTTTSGAITTKAEDIEINISENGERKVELNQNILYV